MWAEAAFAAQRRHLPTRASHQLSLPLDPQLSLQGRHSVRQPLHILLRVTRTAGLRSRRWSLGALCYRSHPWPARPGQWMPGQASTARSPSPDQSTRLSPAARTPLRLPPAASAAPAPPAVPAPAPPAAQPPPAQLCGRGRLPGRPAPAPLPGLPPLRLPPAPPARASCGRCARAAAPARPAARSGGAPQRGSTRVGSALGSHDCTGAPPAWLKAPPATLGPGLDRLLAWPLPPCSLPSAGAARRPHLRLFQLQLLLRQLGGQRHQLLLGALRASLHRRLRRLQLGGLRLRLLRLLRQLLGLSLQRFASLVQLRPRRSGRTCIPGNVDRSAVTTAGPVSATKQPL